MRSHCTCLAILEIVLVFVKDVCVCLPDMLAKHRDGFIPRLVVESQQMHSKLVVDVLGHCLAFVVLLRGFNAILLVLNPARNRRGPILNRRHAFHPKQTLSVFLRHLDPQRLISTHRMGRVRLRHREIVLCLFTPETMLRAVAAIVKFQLALQVQIAWVCIEVERAMLWHIDFIVRAQAILLIVNVHFLFEECNLR